MSGTGASRMLAFRADPSNPIHSTIAWQLVGIAVSGVGVALAAVAVLNAVEPRRGWLLGGLALAIVFLAALVREAARLFRSGGRLVTSPRVAFALTLLAIVMLGCFAVGLGDPATYRLTLLVPVLIAAVIGSRLMLAATFTTALAVTAVVATIDGTTGRALLSLLVTSTAVWSAVVLIVYVLTRAAVDGIGNSLRLASIAAVASQVDDADEGLPLVLPDLLTVTGADQLWLLRVPRDGGAPTVVRAWPHPEAPCPADPSELEQVTAGRHLTTSRSGGTAFVTEQAGSDVVLVVARRWSPFGERLFARESLQRAVVSLRVLLDRSELVGQLRELTTIDELTGLPNRRGLTARLELEMATAARTGRSLCVAMVDLDHFKAYNDDFGHLAGDDVLRRVATLLRDRLRSTDLAARYGGEELCLVLPDTDLGGAAALVMELLARVRQLPAARPVTFSAGLTQWNGSERIEELLHRADLALYRAKREGRDRVVLASHDD